MDIREYISSGVIEAYVTGLASEEEVRILMCIQQHSPEVRAAVRDAQQALEDLADSQAVPPPPGLKAAIWDRLKSEQPAESPVVPEPVKQPAQVIPLGRTAGTSSGRLLRPVLAAASVLLAVSVGLNFYFHADSGRHARALLQAQADRAASEKTYAGLKQKWDLWYASGARMVRLQGVDQHPGIEALVFVGPGNGAVSLSLERMPPVPPGKQYQLWAIVDGKPVSLGVCDQDAVSGLQKMEPVAGAQAFAITLEDEGGSETPTLDQMFVMGAV